jgi:hypothetical protein
MLVTITFQDRTLNTIPPSQPESAEQRTERQMRLCAEMADLAAQLARAAAARALAAKPEESSPSAAPAAEPPSITAAESQSITAAEPPSITSAEPPSITSAEPPSIPTPGTPAPRARATATGPRTPSIKIPSCKPIDPALLFIRLVATMRACIALEARLAAGLAGLAGRPRAAAGAAPADSRRALLIEGLRHITENLPARAERLREATSHADQCLEADPDHSFDVSDLICTICDDLGIDIDFARLPDKFLPPIPKSIDPNMNIDDLIERRATYPP